MNSLEILFCLLTAKVAMAEFVMNEMKINDENLKVCSYCDERSDRLASSLVAEQLREYMTTDHVKIVVDRGDVMVQQSYPNEGIDTGHHCVIKAEAKNIIGTAKMIPETTELDPAGIVYDVQNEYAIAGQTVEHSLRVDLTVRLRKGIRHPFDHGCWHLFDEDCAADAQSKGKNRFSINLQASNVDTPCISGFEYLSFNVNATLTSEKLEDEYDIIAHNVGKCKYEILGIQVDVISDEIQKYAQRYINRDTERFTELRGEKLVAELQNKLGAEMGSEVLIKLTKPDGSSRECSNDRLTSCVRKSCPEGFTRIAQSEMCERFFGMTKPDCGQFGPDAELYERPYGDSTLYWCHTPRIVA